MDAIANKVSKATAKRMELKKAATVGTLEYGPAAFEKADR